MARDDYKEGFGVIDHDGLRVRTVSDTRQAAIVNWLMTEGRTLVRSYHSEDQIEAMWNAKRGEAMVMPVRIHVAR